MHSGLHLLHCTWLGYITSCIKDSSHGFLANRSLVYSRVMGLSSPLEFMVYHLLREMTGLGYWDGFSTVRALVCMVTHWTGLMVSHDLRLSNSHEFTKFFYCVISQPWENIEFVLKLAVALTYGWDHKLIIYSLWIGSLLMEASSNKYSQ